MTEQVRISDLSSGWIASDDQVSGRKTGLLRMDSVTLDENGALIMANGTRRHSTVYPALAHTLFSKFVCGTKRRYLGLVSGAIYRDATAIVAAAGASLTRGAFGVFSDFVLLSTGKAIFKDTCAGTVSNIVLDPPTVKPTVVGNATTFISSAAAGVLTNFVAEYGILTTTIALVTINTSAAFSGYFVGSAHNTNAGDFPPKDLSGIDDDIFQFDFSVSDTSTFKSMSINFLLNAGSTDYYALEISAADIIGASPGVTFTISKKRSDFSRVGTDATLSWNTVTGIQLICRSILGNNNFKFSNFKFTDVASSPLNGTYDWIQLNVLKSGAYEAKSIPGPVSDSLTLENASVLVTPQSPAVPEPEANQIWIYRRGGNLPFYYRVKVVTSPYAAFTDNLSDDDALALGIILNENLLTISSANLTDDIVEIVGPVNGRMLYFTTQDLLLTPPNQPDSFDPAITVKICGTAGEIFYWARKVAENVVLVGTSHDVYSFSGSFITFPDGTLDAYLRPLGLDKPPICRDVAVYKTSLIYYSPFGWTILSTGGDHTPLVYPNLTLLYGHISRYEYKGVLNVIADGFRYSICISKDKVFCVVPTGDDTDTSPDSARFEVYDLLAKTWRPLPYIPTLLYTEEDGNVIGFFADLHLNSLDQSDTKLLNKT